MNERRDTTTNEQRATSTPPQQQDTARATAEQQQRSAAATAEQQRTAAGTATAEQQRMRVERGETQGAQMQQGDGNVELLPRENLDDFRVRWERVQVAFVDEPRTAVQQAHDLVDQLVERLTQSFSRQRDSLEGTWTRGGDVSTEDLRQALQRYRSFFNRLLST